MAAYPSLPLTTNSEPRRLDGYEPVRATNGLLKMRKMFNADKFEFDLEHELTASQKTSLESHYAGDKTNSFSFTWPGGSTYTVKYMMSPQYRDMPGGWFVARVKLGEA
jgi:hypothetical protein